MPPDYYARVAQTIELAHIERGCKQELAFTFHTNSPLNSAMRKALNPSGSANRVIHGKEYDLLTAVDEMVKADVLVASVSSLSHVAGLIGNQSAVFYPGDARGTKERLGMLEALGWIALPSRRQVTIASMRRVHWPCSSRPAG